MVDKDQQVKATCGGLPENAKSNNGGEATAVRYRRLFEDFRKSSTRAPRIYVDCEVRPAILRSK